MESHLIEYFGFSANPFESTLPDNKFYNPKRKTVLAELHFWAEQGQHFIAVVGPDGSGRTTLANAYLATCSESDISLLLSVNGVCDAAGLQQQVADKLGVEPDLLEILDELVRLEVQGKKLILAVDNAEKLDDSALLLLLRLSQGQQKTSAQIVVFASDDIFQLLEKITDSQELYRVVLLEPWDKQESLDYLNFRLTMAGKNISLFSDSEKNALYKNSQGWPGALHQQAIRLLNLKSDRQPVAEPHAQLDLKRILLYLAALMVVTGLAIGLWQYANQPLSTQQTSRVLDLQVDGKTISPEQAQTPDALWYLSKEKDRYTLQVFGTRSESVAKNYVQTHGSEYHYFVKTHQGNKLFVVTYGNFANQEQAIAATEEARASSVEKPWARSFGALQQEIE